MNTTQEQPSTSPAQPAKKKARIPRSRLRHNLSKSVLRVPLEWVRHRGLWPTDVFIGSYPRSGRTWSRFVLYEILTGRESNFADVNATLQGVYSLSHGIPVLPNGGRVVNTHEAYRREYKKALVLVRDVRDVVLSEYAYLKGLEFFDGTLDEFIPRFCGVGGKVNGYGTWHSHVASWLDSPIAGTPNLLLVQYEELRRQPEEWFGRIVDFFGVHVTPERIAQAVAHNSIREMKEKERKQPQMRSGDFVRSGSIRGWRDKLTASQVKLVEKHTGGVLQRLGYQLSSEIAEPAVASPRA
ncbi:MAG TPA: sulfotransferase domain-containing protein [Terriglobales bacterium]